MYLDLILRSMPEGVTAVKGTDAWGGHSRDPRPSVRLGREQMNRDEHLVPRGVAIVLSIDVVEKVWWEGRRPS